MTFCVNSFKRFYNTVRFSRYFLCASWCVFLIFGTLTAEWLQDRFVYYFACINGWGSVSFLGLLFPVFLPIVAAAFLRYKSMFGWLYILCIIKAFFFGFCHYGIFLCFINAGCLIRLLLYFSDSLASVIYLYFCIENFGVVNKKTVSEAIICSSLILIVLCVDILYIAPFINTLILL